MTDVTVVQMFWFFLFVEAFFVEYTFFTWVLGQLKKKDAGTRPMLVAATCVVWAAAVILTCGIALGYVAIPGAAGFMP